MFTGSVPAYVATIRAKGKVAISASVKLSDGGCLVLDNLEKLADYLRGIGMSVVTPIKPEALTFSTHATLTTSVGRTPRREAPSSAPRPLLAAR